MDLDHVALGLRDVRETLFTLVGDLGAVVEGGGQSVGFRIVQVRVGPAGDGMKIELMEPWAAERFDFLARFLDRNGEGAHHITFKVADIRAELTRLDGAGYAPVRTQLTNPWWREAFFHPKQTHGTVIQLAEAHFDPSLIEDYQRGFGEGAEAATESEFGSVEWWPEPPPRGEPPATLRRVVIGVPELESARAFFADAMRGTASEVDGRVEVAWPGGGRVLLEERPGDPGVDRYECERAAAPESRVIGGVRVVTRPPGG